jgi:hypothetical protein
MLKQNEVFSLKQGSAAVDKDELEQLLGMLPKDKCTSSATALQFQMT